MEWKYSFTYVLLLLVPIAYIYTWTPQRPLILSISVPKSTLIDRLTKPDSKRQSHYSYFLLYQDWKSKANTFSMLEIHFSLLGIVLFIIQIYIRPGHLWPVHLLDEGVPSREDLL
jgi:hypothetical protein